MEKEREEEKYRDFWASLNIDGGEGMEVLYIRERLSDGDIYIYIYGECRPQKRETKKEE